MLFSTNRPQKYISFVVVGLLLAFLLSIQVAQAQTPTNDELDTRIDTERDARATADTALETADTALGTRIDTERDERADADTALGTRIDTERDERADADTTEQNARAEADTALETADTALGTRIDTERD
ncbi:MAG: hypothetical protein HFP76_00430, partial [Methylococcales symbiont of Iophon sp. n. MRB-2018]